MNSVEFQLKITELAALPKQLDKNGIDELKKIIQVYADIQQSNDIEVLLPFIINVVYDEAYNAACNDILKLLRSDV